MGQGFDHGRAQYPQRRCKLSASLHFHSLFNLEMNTTTYDYGSAPKSRLTLSGFDSEGNVFGAFAFSACGFADGYF